MPLRIDLISPAPRAAFVAVTLLAASIALSACAERIASISLDPPSPTRRLPTREASRLVSVVALDAQGRFDGSAAASGQMRRVALVIDASLGGAFGQALRDQYTTQNALGREIVELRLTSLGGFLSDGLDLADAVRELALPVRLTGACASACSFPAFAALRSGGLHVHWRNAVEVHQAGVKGSPCRECLPDMERYLRGLDLPERWVQATLTTPPETTYSLWPWDLKAEGAILYRLRSEGDLGLKDVTEIVEG